jgi:hypothetical protein
MLAAGCDMREGRMRRVLLALIGIAAAGIAQAETYGFTTVVNKSWWYQTLIHCAGLATGRVPQGRILSEPAIAYPNLKTVRNQPGVACAAGHPIEFYPDGTLKYCKLNGEQHFELIGPPGVGACFDFAYFDENGRADCD